MVVTCWRLWSLLAREYRRLESSGELGERLAQRRAVRIDRALARERMRAPIRVPVFVGVRHHASVQTGARRTLAQGDIDDLDLLDASMRRRAPRSGTSNIARSAPEPTDQGVVEPAVASEPVRADDFTWLEAGVRRRDVTQSGIGWLAPVVLVVGAVGTFVPLVRPLSDASPWISLGSGALVALGWWRSRV